MKSHLDLRCNRRLAVNEGQVILDALDQCGVVAKGLREKLRAAMALAVHECPPCGKCPVCGLNGEFVHGVRNRRREDFTVRMARAFAKPKLKLGPRP